MKYYVRSLKFTWNFIFWILFLTVAFFSLTESKILDISKVYFSSILGALLIFNRVYLVKGRIKRLPYFLNLAALFFILILIQSITNIPHFSQFLSTLDLSTLKLSYFSQSLSTVGLSVIKSSYFSTSYPLVLLTAKEVYTLIWQTLNLKPMPFFDFLIGMLFCLGIFYLFVTLHIKRLRDVKFSYWWTLLTLIPGINVLFTIFLCLKKSAKRSKKKNKNKNKKAKKDKVNVIEDSPGLIYKP